MINSGFQAMRRPPERPEALIAQYSHMGRILEMVSNVGEELHIVSWIRIMSGPRDLRREWRLWFLDLPPKPRIFNERSFIKEKLDGETTL